MVESHLGEIVAVGSAICWTITAAAFESAGKKVGSLAVNLIRLIIAFILTGIFTLFTRGMYLPLDAPRSAWIYLLISGTIGFVIGDLFLFQAYVVIGSRISLLIMSSVPPITAVVGFFTMGERVTYLTVGGMLITIAGIACVILSKTNDDKKVRLSHPIKGVVFAFIGALGQAFGMIFSKMGMGTYNPFAATQIRIIAAILGFLIVISLSKKWKEIVSALRNGAAMRSISVGSIFGPFLGVSLSLLAVQYTTTSIVSTITSISPILIIPVSIIIFKEKVRPREILGAFITILGVVLLFM